ncbi:Photosystem II protein PsbZ, partial [uncultured Leptolyngbya sp.]
AKLGSIQASHSTWLCFEDSACAAGRRTKLPRCL